MFFFLGGVGWGVGRDPKSNLQISDFKRMASVHLGYSCHLPTTRLLTKWHAPACTVSFHVVSSTFLNFLSFMIVLCMNYCCAGFVKRTITLSTQMMKTSMLQEIHTPSLGRQRSRHCNVPFLCYLSQINCPILQNFVLSCPSHCITFITLLTLSRTGSIVSDIVLR